MRGKIHLVAMREFLENVRTKTFWIGILAFPLIFVIAAVVGGIMNRAKAPRTYAVLDRSEDQWLSNAVRARIASRDVSSILEGLQSEDPEARAKAEQELRQRLESLPEDHPIRRLLARIKERYPDDDALDRLAKDPSALAGALKEIAFEWMQSLTATDRSALANLTSDLGLVKYPEVELGELGDDPEATLNRRLENGSLFAYFVIGPDPVASNAGSNYVSNNQTDRDLREWYARHAAELVREKRIAQIGLSKAEARSILDSYSFEAAKVGAGGKTEKAKTADVAFQFAPVAFVYLLWIAVFTAANMLLTNTIEEKSNRIIEVLLSSVSPFQLMAGKVWGIAATGLAVVGFWAAFGLLGIWLLPQIFPDISKLQLDVILANPRYLGSFVGYFLGGYLLYAAVLVGIGSVCNSLKEAQNLMQPVVLMLIVPLLAMIPIANDPNGPVARVMTYIPLFTPFVMMNRAAGEPPLWEYVISTLLMLATIAFMFWAAAKVFRIGVLMTGKPPRLREILRWIRAPVR